VPDRVPESVPEWVPKLNAIDNLLRAPVRVTLTGAMPPFTSGEMSFELSVTNMRGLLRALNDRFPGIGEVLEEDTAVAIDGVIHEVVYTQVLPPGCEVFFIPRLESG
jgi:sulfur-carrier protein